MKGSVLTWAELGSETTPRELSCDVCIVGSGAGGATLAAQLVARGLDVVMLEEGVKMVTNILDCPAEPEALILDMPLEVTFESRGDLSVPQFRPAGGAA